MEYFKIDQFPHFRAEKGKRYNSEGKGAEVYKDTRAKLQYLGHRLGKELGVEITNNYHERPNKMAGQGRPPVLKEYIITGFAPSKYGNQDNVFVKLAFHGFDTEIQFTIEVDVNFYKNDNQYKDQRYEFLHDTSWMIPVNEDFPDNWDDLIKIANPFFQENINYINRIYMNQLEYRDMDKYIKILEQKKQIILQGPPGTGKTYNAKNIAEFIITGNISEDKKLQKELLEETGQFELIQFHPSYTYEDFVRSITVNVVNGQPEYVTENKVLGRFAAMAHDNSILSRKDDEVFSKEKQIEKLLEDFAEHVRDEIDEKGEYKITEAVSIVEVDEEAFRYQGNLKWSQRMKFNDLVKAQLNGVTSRQEFKKTPDISGLALHHSSYFFKILCKFQELYKDELQSNETPEVDKPPLKKYVLIIDEINRANLPAVLGELIYALEYRNESVNSMYAIDDDLSIVIPENLYIIGTMNTADRSVGHIDYAIRRRFAFEKMLPNVDVIETDKGKEYFKIIENLFINDSLSPDYKNSKEDVQIGHSYFMGCEENLKMRMKYEVLPIIQEYLKDGIFKEEARATIEEFERSIS